jgi:outer membrane protein assembly factor BamE
MLIKATLKRLSILTYVMVLAGCSFPGVHRVEVQQGNIMDAEMVSKLQLGMTKSQVRYIMGTPIIADTFNQDRWDYYYSNQTGNRLKKRESVTVFFINEKVSRIDNNLEGKTE